MKNSVALAFEQWYIGLVVVAHRIKPVACRFLVAVKRVLSALSAPERRVAARMAIVE